MTYKCCEPMFTCLPDPNTRPASEAPWYHKLNHWFGFVRWRLESWWRWRRFTTYTFPKINATFPPLITKELVSVQPMMGPSSLVFYMEFAYAPNKAHQDEGSGAPALRDMPPGPQEREGQSQEAVAEG